MFSLRINSRKEQENNNESFGVLRYSSINIGDEIQSLAAMRFLPHIDYYIHRERTDKFKSNNNEKVKMIMNAWWMWDKTHFPPSEDIDPLFISFHLREAIRDKFITENIKDYMKRYEPIGCRDTGTMEFLKSKGIDAYFSGCLTLTLLPNENIRKLERREYILCVDVPEELQTVIKERTQRPVYNITRMLSPAFTSIERFEVAKYLLYIYHNAYCVITPRLHVALPCTAFQTPICLLKSDTLKRNGRFDGLEDICNEVILEEYLKDASLYDINNPPENPKTYLTMRDKLVSKCIEFTGYDSNKSIFGDDYNPLLEMIKLLAYDKKVLKRLLMFADEKDLVKALNKKVVEKETKHDLSY